MSSNKLFAVYVYFPKYDDYMFFHIYKSRAYCKKIMIDKGISKFMIKILPYSFADDSVCKFEYYE